MKQIQDFFYSVDYQLVVKIFFYFFAGITILGAALVLLTKNVLYAAYSLLLTFLGVAALYVFASADFLAVSQIMIYVGGILVLLIFGVMLTKKQPTERNSDSTNQVSVLAHNQAWAMGIAVIIFGGILKAIFEANFHIIKKTLPIQKTINKIGLNLLTDYVFVFELIGFLLLIVLIGASFIAKKEQKNA